MSNSARNGRLASPCWALKPKNRPATLLIHPMSDLLLDPESSTLLTTRATLDIGTLVACIIDYGKVYRVLVFNKLTIEILVYRNS